MPLQQFDESKVLLVYLVQVSQECCKALTSSAGWRCQISKAMEGVIMYKKLTLAGIDHMEQVTPTHDRNNKG